MAKARKHPVRITLLCICACALTGIGVALAQTGSSAVATDAPPVRATADAAVASQFTALQGPGSLLTKVDPVVQRYLSNSLEGTVEAVYPIHAGRDFQFYAARSSTGDVCGLQVTPGNGAAAVCSLDSKSRSALARGMVLRSDDARGNWLVTALVPDGATDITLTVGDGSRQKLAVSNNLAAITVSGPPQSIEWVRNDGTSERYAFDG